jgi:hypothetical protein
MVQMVRLNDGECHRWILFNALQRLYTGVCGMDKFRGFLMGGKSHVTDPKCRYL